MGPEKGNSLYTFDQAETTRDQAKMNLAGHRDWRLSENYFEPCNNEVSICLGDSQKPWARRFLSVLSSVYPISW